MKGAEPGLSDAGQAADPIPLPPASNGNRAAESRAAAPRISTGGRRWAAAACAVILLGLAPLGWALFQRQLLVDQLQRSREECNRADENLLLAMSAFSDRIDRLGLESRLLPKEELAFYKTIYDEAGDEPGQRFAIAMARRRAAVLHLKLHEFDDARLCFMLAIHMLETLAVERPEPELAMIYRRNLAETYVDDAAYQAAIGDIPAAEARFASALSLLSKLMKKKPDSDDLIFDQARFWQARGAMYARLHRWADAEADLHRAMAPWAARVYVETDSKVWLGIPACELAAVSSQLSDVYRETHRASEAIEMLNQAAAVYSQFGRYHADLHYREGLAEVFEKLAGAYADDGKLAQSADAYRKALAAYDALDAEYPEISAFRRKHAQIESRLSATEKTSSQRE